VFLEAVHTFLEEDEKPENEKNAVNIREVQL
jgi:hypothetical protein